MIRSFTLAGLLWIIAGILDFLRRLLWLEASSQPADLNVILVLVAARILPWMVYSLALIGLVARFPILKTLSGRSIAAHFALLLLLVAAHPLVLGFAAISIDLPGAHQAAWGMLYLDILLNYLPLDLSVALAATAVVLALGFRVQTLSMTQSADGHPGQIQIRKANQQILVPVDQITWIAAAGNYVQVHTDQVVHLARGNISRLAERLDPQRFVRTHRSVIANITRASALKRGPGGWRLALDNGHSVPVSRRRVPQLRQHLDTIGT